MDVELSEGNIVGQETLVEDPLVEFLASFGGVDVQDVMG